ncbi:hypothetical protein GP486_001181 [Trichoglossum hirsutum]|uniref:Zinc transporter n=1 Tax=Trichoglossum hirsutum TaxID=265104 RepID=A0A9P8RTC5_9PEZI|nr:hypothetical protein GP486_001181 [Trichoglossum hirsutum]
MLVQTFYGIATGSLGLLSDSIHMLFDCLALLVGLCAAVMSKWPPSMRFPYGLGKMDTLAGLISVEIVIEAIERLVQGSEMRRIGELLTVSSLGLGVNLVGLLAFDHAHHGHGHSHGSHNHGTSQHYSCGNERHPHHEHPHSRPSSTHGHDVTHLCSHNTKDHHNHEPSHGHDSHSTATSQSTPAVPATPKTSAHATAHEPGHHHHSNENMHGIFLHVLADTLGSVAVVISTLLIKYFGWSGFDPLASCLIAVLIFASAIPLVSSSAKTLLLAVPADTEYKLRETLTGVSGLRGVVGYCVPRFWLEDATGTSSVDSGAKILGVIHVIISKNADVRETQSRVVAHLGSSGLDAVVQIEQEGEGRCWCGGGNGKTGGS